MMACSRVILAMPLMLYLGCGVESEREPAKRGKSVQPSLSGMYEVKGVTTVIETGATRPIQGALILAQDGAGYSATFHLETSYPTPDGNVHAEVIGQGDGMIEGDTLRGQAETQILMAMAPGIDTRFPFLPRLYGPRIVSSSVGTLKSDGSIQLAIETQPAEGERYPPTRTTMTGVRAKPRGVPGFPGPGGTAVQGDGDS